MPTSTQLIYLRDSSRVLGEAILVNVCSTAQGQTKFILNSTIFYPQGGGQPSDTGSIQVLHNSDKLSFKISSVQMIEDKKNSITTVEHSLDENDNQFIPGANWISSLPLPVIMSIDEERRLLHSRLHTAGHLLDIVIMDIMKIPLAVSKAYHFPAGPHILYSGHITFKDDKVKTTLPISYSREEFLKAVEDHCNRIIAANPRSIIKHESPTDDYAMRCMSIEGFEREIPCGGTHVPHLSLLGPRMKVRKVQVRSNDHTVRVSYCLE